MFNTLRTEEKCTELLVDELQFFVTVIFAKSGLDYYY